MAAKVRRVDFSPVEFLEGISDLDSAIQIAVYWVVIALIYARREAIAYDVRWINNSAKCYRRADCFTAIQQLIAKGKLYLTADGRLMNPRAARELQNAAERMASPRRSRVDLASISRRSRVDLGPVSSHINGLGLDSPSPSPSPPKNHSLTTTESAAETRARDVRESERNGRMNGWHPSPELISALKRARPDLSDADIARRTAEWEDWRQGKSGATRNPAKSWRWFLDRTTAAQPKRKRPRPQI